MVVDLVLCFLPLLVSVVVAMFEKNSSLLTKADSVIAGRKVEAPRAVTLSLLHSYCLRHPPRCCTPYGRRRPY